MDGSFNTLPWPVQKMMMDKMAAENQARQRAGGVLYGMFPEQQQQTQAVPPQMRAPMPPPQAMPAPPPGSMSPGGGNPAAAGGQQPQQPQAMAPGAPNGPRAQMMAPQPGAGAGPQRPPMPQIAPFRALPQAAPQVAPEGSELGAPPQAPQPAANDVSQPKPFDLRSMVQGLKRSGVPSEKVMDMLDQLSPVMNTANRQELDGLKVQVNAERAASQAYKAVMDTERHQREAKVKEDAEARRKEQGDAKIQILKLKATNALGGDKNLKSMEIVYPKGSDGKPDTAQGPNGVRALTKSGKIVYLDMEGRQVNQIAGATAKEAKNVKVTDTVRSNLVGGGVSNALNRLGEIEKDLKGVTTSSFFGQHGDNPVTRKLYGTARGAMDKKSQMADARWNSFIDEAIPVFTGGLRGSDAFRRFLIEQVPGPGDEQVWAEKARLFRENIEGTRRAFFDKFSSDKSMWGPGVTKDQVEASKAGGAAPKPAGSAGSLSTAEQAELEQLRKRFAK